MPAQLARRRRVGWRRRTPVGMKWVAGLRRQPPPRACPRSTRSSSSTTPLTGLPTRDPRRRADLPRCGPPPCPAWRSGRFVAWRTTGRAPRAALIGAGITGPQPPRGARPRPAPMCIVGALSTGTPTGPPRSPTEGRGDRRDRAPRPGGGPTPGGGRQRGRRGRHGRLVHDAGPAPGADRRLAARRTPSWSPSITRRMLHADVARTAPLFLVDERGQFLANRDAGQFDGYPDPTATLGEAILAGMGRPARGPGSRLVTPWAKGWPMSCSVTRSSGRAEAARPRDGCFRAEPMR